MNLYRWQEDCLERWEQNGYRGILHVITGAGKTVAALEGARRLEQNLLRRGTPLDLRVVVPTIAIARQWVRAVSAAFPEEVSSGRKKVGLWFGGTKDSEECFCLIYVVNSARHALSGQIIRRMREGRAVMLIADECHHYGSRENRKIFDARLSPRFREDLYFTMGLSATPQCEHFEDELVPALGPEIYWYQLRQAIHEGTVSSFSVFQVDVSLTVAEAEEYAELTRMIVILWGRLVFAFPELKESFSFARLRALAQELDDPDSLPQQYINLVLLRRELCIKARNRIGCAVSLVRRRSPRDRIIIFCERIDQAETVRKALRELLPSQTGMYHSEMLPEKRREVLKDFRDGVIRVLIACKALDEGVDVPDASTGIVISTTMTDRQRIQRLGRILRRAEGKRQAVLYFLRVGGIVEDDDYLPDLNEGQPTANLSYLAADDRFDSGEYTFLARSALRDAQRQGAGEALQRELRRRLDHSVPDPEWLMRPEDLEQMIRETPDQPERNRLIAMKMIARARAARLADENTDGTADETADENMDGTR